MGEKYEPQKGDRVRVVLEGEVTPFTDSLFKVGLRSEASFIHRAAEHVVSIEKIEPDAVLPDGLTVSEDGNLLNWRGENYVRQPVDEPVEVFGPGDTVRRKKYPEYVYTIAENGWYEHSLRYVHEGVTPPFTGEHYERVTLAGVPF